MLVLTACILINTLIGIIFKYFGKWEVNILVAIVINYFICVITGSLVNGSLTVNSEIIDKAWFGYAIFLGFVFVSIFNFFAWTVKIYGVMIATIFQKMSLLFPAIIGIAIYNESGSNFKITGIIMAILAIMMISFPGKGSKLTLALFWLPIITWLGSGVIEVTLFYVDIEQIALSADIGFVSSIFFFAGIFGMMFLMIYSLKARAIKIRRKDFAAGVLLGIPNFFSIYLILILLDQGWQGSVLFPINNVGILFLSSLVGVWVFSEKLDTIKAMGFIASIISIILVAQG